MSYASRKMINAAFVLGIISLCSFFVFFVSIPCGALAIILALLSRGERISHKGKIAVIAGIIGIVITTGFTSYSIVTTINAYGGMDGFLQAYEDYAHEFGYDIDLGIDDNETGDTV